MTDLMVIERQGLRVLTTAQLAECYGTDSKTIAHNYQRNKERYEDGKHYVCLKGTELQEFFANANLALANQSKIRTLYLWTERGALLHAKSLNTDKAWEVYGELVETYFRAKTAQTALQNLSPQLQAMINLEVRQNNLESRMNDLERRITTETVPEPAPKKPQGKPWSEREKDYLRKAYALGQTDVEIAADMGRTEDSVYSKRRALGLYEDGGSRINCRWRPDEDKKLIKYYNQGVTFYDIGQLINRSADGVQNRLHRLRKEGKI